jgi:Peptidase family C25
MNEPTLTFNGIDGATGAPLYPPLSAAEMSALARNKRPDPRQTKETIAWREEVTRIHLGLREGYDPRDLASSGWGVVFPQATDPAVREALAPLLEHRQKQAAARSEKRFRELAGETGYRPGESKPDFLRRLGMSTGPADPDRVPYYLLLVGSPEEIPWSFQHQLETQYAVGRLCLDTPEDYACYAQTVIAAETGRFDRPRRTVLFGAANPDDPNTHLMADHLVRPLAAELAGCGGVPVETVLAEEATKQRLGSLLGGASAPSLLFTATHGVGFQADDPRQPAHQGALLCQDWPGPRVPGSMTENCYLAGDDVAGDAPPSGLIAFFYACHGVGTPQYDAYPQRAPAGEDRRRIAPRPFTAGLPRRLLSHPKGGALAVIGHVERTWGYSFLWEGVGAQSQVFTDTLRRLLDGYPVGAALEPFGLRLGELAVDLTALLDAASFNEPVDEKELIRLWTAHNDARAYAVLGDPAVRVVQPIS